MGEGIRRLLPTLCVAIALSGDPAAGGGVTGCIGDCDGDGVVSVHEIIRGVRIALGEAPAESCPVLRRGFNIDGLVTAVRLALEGCTVVRDFSDFTTFRFSREPALGFCPPQDEIFSASIEPAEGAGYLFTRTRLVDGTIGVDPCLPGLLGETACPVVRPEARRLLTAAELTQVRAQFVRVERSNSPLPACLDVIFDPCLITVATWDGSGGGDFPCAAPRFERDELVRIIGVVDALAPGITGSVCGDGVLDAGEECDDGPSAVRGGDGCAANCTRETRHPCQLGPRSRIRLATEAFPVSILPGGSQVFSSGAPRAEPVFGETTVQAPGQIPLVVSAADLAIDPVKVTGLACVCLRPIASDALAAVGAVDCSRGYGSAQLDYRLAISVLEDAGRCGVSCDVPAYGADCTPCTDDDTPSVEPRVGRLTTGGVFFDGETVYGQPFSCSALSTPGSPASGVTLVGSLGDAQVALACE